MKRIAIIVSLVSALTAPVWGVVFLSEVFINPPGSDDDTREFIELQGTPGRRLDGYAVAFLSGGQQKYYPLGSIGSGPGQAIPELPEVDEFFSLDGLSLGPNGILVLGIGTTAFYPTLTADTAFRRWNTIWNGGLDTPGKLQNDGSNTVVLVRRRPGITQADPSNALGLRWGKDISIDAELFTPVIDPADGLAKDLWGDGNLDKGQPNGLGGNTLDLKGASTPGDVSDDLEVVDEVSYEHDRGWEYDMDGRRVDEGSTHAGLPRRRVHALGDPQGFNPDALTRVDYRTKGPGWQPAPGATGEAPGGRNWQDTATEQWIRGESVGGAGTYFYDNGPNTNPDAIQPFLTNVPAWLADGTGPEYDFGAMNTYPIMAGRTNPMALPFIPGDCDRDGDCDLDDIAKIAAVFGNDDWVFSNSFAAAPEGDAGDPAAQIRPWDVDATGDNGVESSDLQWTLNFQGNLSGRVVGRRYDDNTPTPPGAGVYLNPVVGTVCQVSAVATTASGRPTTALRVGDLVTIEVRGRLSAGANAAAGQENGIMQFVHDLVLGSPGVVRVVSVDAVTPFRTTRGAIQELLGAAGDLGIRRINGHTTSFTEGLGGDAAMYRVTLRALAIGSTTASLTPSTEPKFAAGTPRGLKIGHSDNHGNPASALYPAAIPLAVTTVAMDADADGDVDLADFAAFQNCFNGPNRPWSESGVGCADFDADADTDVDLADFGVFQACFNGPNRAPACP